MIPQGITKSFDIGDGRIITIETGKLAKQADGAVVVRMGDTMLLATVVSKKEAGENVDFMPLTVDYQEKYAASGKFPGGFIKRETRPSEYEILISRLVDRALRPLFPEDYHADTQVLIYLISSDKNTTPDALAGLAASAAIAVSDIPFHGPISEVRVARIDGQFVINPSVSELPKADLEIMVAASMDNIMMVEGEMKEISEEDMIKALQFAHNAIKVQCKAQIELASMVAKAQNKRVYCHENNDLELKEKMHKELYQKAYDIAKLCNPNKHERSEAFEKIEADFMATLSEEEQKEKKFLIHKYFHDIHKEAVRNMILDDKLRLDGRKLNEIRPIWCEVNYLPSAHGSSVFTRGETQSLTSVTLGTKLDQQTIDGAFFEGSTKFMLHYNFPSFSTGEVKPNRGLGRREIGHGNLAMRALKQVIPTGDENPYTIRVVSDILESNGSSSMATVCAGTLALMDAGVKITKPVAGIAMGLITDTKSGKYSVLSDILGDEDHLGDMDFKVCGTKDGITACQMDIKVDGLSEKILSDALMQAKEGRMHILGKITEVISEPRTDYKPHAPRIEKIRIPKEFIGAVIGPGGKIIQEMQKETGATIIIEEQGNFGVIDIFCDNKEGLDKAMAKIKAIVAQPEIGETYTGKVMNIQTFGAFIEIMPGKDGLLHISEIDWKHFEKMEDTGINIGDTIEVKLIDFDKKSNKLKLSRKALLPKPEGYKAPQRNNFSQNKDDRQERPKN